MGALIEINDTLKLKQGNGFPVDLRLGEVYDFTIDGRRLYNQKPSRVFLVEEIDGKWNYRGHGQILYQTINNETVTTSGKFEVILIYPPEYITLVNKFEPPVGRGYVP